MDDRAMAIAIGTFVVLLITAAMLYAFSDRAMDTIHDEAQNSSAAGDSDFDTGLQRVRTANTVYLVGVTFVGVAGMLATGVHLRRRA